jgi:hypothetical protein
MTKGRELDHVVLNTLYHRFRKGRGKMRELVPVSVDGAAEGAVKGLFLLLFTGARPPAQWPGQRDQPVLGIEEGVAQRDFMAVRATPEDVAELVDVELALTKAFARPGGHALDGLFHVPVYVGLNWHD